MLWGSFLNSLGSRTRLFYQKLIRQKLLRLLLLHVLLNKNYFYNPYKGDMSSSSLTNAGLCFKDCVKSYDKVYKNKYSYDLDDRKTYLQLDIYLGRLTVFPHFSMQNFDLIWKRKFSYNQTWKQVLHTKSML